MLTKKIISSTLVLALSASVAMLSGCPTPGGTEPSPSVSPTETASVTPSTTASASTSVTPSTTASASTSVTPSTTASASTTATPSSVTPSATQSSTPSSQTGGTSDIKERATFNGTVYDQNNTVLDGAKVTAKSIDPAVTWVGQDSITANGAYVFQNAPVGVRIQIDATKDGYTQRTQTVVLKSNLTGDPNANKYDFVGQFALQDEPEITSLKVNAKLATSAGGDAGTIALNAPNALNANTATALSGVDPSKFVVEMAFSEAVDQASVESNFRAYSETAARGALTTPFSIDSSYGTFSWSTDGKTATFTSTKPLLTLTSGTELRYQIVFVNPFKDKAGKQSINDAAIRYSAANKADYLTFSLANDDTPFTLDSVSVQDNVNGSYDRILMNFNKSLDVLVKRSIDPTVPNFQLVANGTSLDVRYTLAGVTTTIATLTRYVAGVITPFVAPANLTYEYTNGGKTLIIRTASGTSNFFDLNDRVLVQVRDLKSPGGKSISSDNSTTSSAGGNTTVNTDNSTKIGAAQ